MPVRIIDTAPSRFGPFLIFGVIMALTIGVVTSSVPVAPILFICLLLTGVLVLGGAELSSIEQLILVPAVGLASLALSSLFIPLASALSIVDPPVKSAVVLVVAAATPTVLAIVYWMTRPNPTLPSVKPNPRLIISLLPAALGAVGALIQQYHGVVIQNYVVMGALVLVPVMVLYWADTELETATSLYGIALGTLLSHTLVTPYSVGVDVQMSIHSIEQITQVGVWPIRDIFFRSGAVGVGFEELLKYIGSTLSHTGLPVIIGVPTLFVAVGNVAPDVVFDIVYVAFFALTPVCAFRLARERLSVREAFIAGMLVIVYYRFFHTSPAKQHLAQFFLGALLVLWQTKLEHPRRNVVAMLVATGIIFSHYAVTFLFLGFLIGAYLLIKWYKNSSFISDVSLIFIGYFYGLVTLWYVIITGGQKPLAALTAIVISIQSLLFSSSTQSRSGADVAQSQTLLVDQINLGLHGVLLGAFFLGILGITYHALKTREPVFSAEHDSLSIFFFGLIVISMVATGYLGIDRALDIGLIVLAPVGVYGVKRVFEISEQSVSSPNLSNYTTYVGIFFVILMFSFSSGLMYEAAGESATSAINLHENPNSVMYSDAEYKGAEWVLANRNNSTVYSGLYASTTFHRFSGRSLPYLKYYKDYKSDVVIEWNETGYIFIRRSELTNETERPTPRYQLQYEQYQEFVNRPETERAYANSAVIILRIDSEPRQNTTSEQTLNATAT